MPKRPSFSHRTGPLAGAPLSSPQACLTATIVSPYAAWVQATAGASTPGVINAIGAENEYANVLSQIGGRYVHVSSILNNPNTDPHTFEASPSVAQEVSVAQLIVQNGVGYDTFMNTIEAASPNGARKVIVVQHLLGLPDNTPNPHLWLPRDDARRRQGDGDRAHRHPAGARRLFRGQPGHVRQVPQPWLSAISAFKAKHAATTRHYRAGRRLPPAGDGDPDLNAPLRSAGRHHERRRPRAGGRDARGLGSSRSTRSRSSAYNQQVVDPLTTSIRTTAERAGVPVVGVYETMPTPGYDYQTWMLAEVKAIQAAVTNKTST